MVRLMIIIAFLAFGTVAKADIKLYSCVKDGVALLQDKPIEGCKDMQVHTYAKSKPAETGLREGEKKALNQIEGQARARQGLIDSRYANVDENVGDALMKRESDRRYDECYFFKGRIESALIRIDRNAQDRRNVRQAVAGLSRDHEQYKYYCGREYPGLKRIILHHSLDTNLPRTLEHPR